MVYIFRSIYFDISMEVEGRSASRYFSRLHSSYVLADVKITKLSADDGTNNSVRRVLFISVTGRDKIDSSAVLSSSYWILVMYHVVGG